MWSKRRDYDGHGLGSKPNWAILLYLSQDILRYFPPLGGLNKQF